MENQTNVDNQNSPLTDKDSAIQQNQIPGKTKINFWIVATIVFAILFLGNVGFNLMNFQKKKDLITSQPTPSAINTPFPTESTGSKTNISPTTTATEGNNSGSNWQTYTNRSIPASVYSISIPIGQTGWTLRNITSLDPYYTQDQNLNDEVDIEKNSMKIKIYRPEASGPGVCLYKDSTEFNGPGQKFSDYIEFQLGSRVARRAKAETQITEGKDTYTVCQKEENSQYFVGITEFGYISYEVPTGTNVEEMDSIIKTLRKI